MACRLIFEDRESQKNQRFHLIECSAIDIEQVSVQYYTRQLTHLLVPDENDEDRVVSSDREVVHEVVSEEVLSSRRRSSWSMCHCTVPASTGSTTQCEYALTMHSTLSDTSHEILTPHS